MLSSDKGISDFRSVWRGLRRWLYTITGIIKAHQSGDITAPESCNPTYSGGDNTSYAVHPKA